MGAFKWKTIEVGTKTNHSSLGFPAEQILMETKGGGVTSDVRFLHSDSLLKQFSLSRAHLWPPHPWLDASVRLA